MYITPPTTIGLLSKDVPELITPVRNVHAPLRLATLLFVTWFSDE
jgi:hypothetical protein